MCGELVLLSCHNQRYTGHTIHQVTDPLVLFCTLLSPLGNDLDIIQKSRLPTSPGEVQGYSNFTDLCSLLLALILSIDQQNYKSICRRQLISAIELVAVEPLQSCLGLCNVGWIINEGF